MEMAGFFAKLRPSETSTFIWKWKLDTAEEHLIMNNRLYTFSLATP